MAVNEYDKVPYESFPYPNTHPENIYTIAKLFGVNSPEPKKCRVLELGCASGGNIIPMAVNWPESEFVGIDFSDVQIKEGQKHIASLGLKNIELKTLSITDINEDFGKFDYIIAHGILSWVPKQVQDKIFEIAKNNLTENGVAYISYNTLPGWNSIKSIREMMLFHTSGFADPAVKTKQARLLLEFIRDANTSGNNPYAETIKNEISLLSSAGDSYLAHDHLEQNNEPFYFYQFMENAKNNNLQYLGETSIATMFVGNFSQNTADILKQAAGDIVKTEQYMDFLRNRRFRSTLICHNNVAINRNLKPETIKDFYVSSKIKVDNPEAIDMTASDEVSFTAPSGLNFKTNNRAVITALIYLTEQDAPVEIEKVVSEVKKRLGTKANKDAVRAVILDNFLRLVLADGVHISACAPNYVTKASEKPKVPELSRYQATYGNWVTSKKSEKVGVDTFTRVLIQYIDGTNDANTLVEKMLAHVLKGELVVSVNNQKVTDEAVIRGELEKIVANSLQSLAPKALLVA